MNTLKIKPKKKAEKKPVEEQRWEGEGGQPPERPEDTKRPSVHPTFAEPNFPGSQITKILRNLLGHLPKPQGQ